MTQTANLGRVNRVCCLLLLLAPAAAFAQGDPRAERQFANYAFAHELGSGVYETGGQVLQIYRLPFAWRYREASADVTGISLLLPATLGFRDFQPTGILQEELPDRIDSISFVPGIALEFLRGAHWRVRPFMKVGVDIANQNDIGGTLYSLGVQNEYLRSLDDGWQLHFRDDLIYSGVNYRGTLPTDTFVRWRNAFEATNSLARHDGRAHEAETGFFAVLDWYLDPPTGAVTGVDVAEAQLELGVMIGARPALRWRRWSLPRVGLSYRFAGDVSAWRLVFGAPF